MQNFVRKVAVACIGIKNATIEALKLGKKLVPLGLAEIYIVVIRIQRVTEIDNDQFMVLRCESKMEN